MNPRSQIVNVLSPAVALMLAYTRIRIHEFRVLIFNPLALIFAVFIICGCIWILVIQGDQFAHDPSTNHPYIAGFVFGLCIIIVSLTAQRGSPLRLKPGDVSWVLQSHQGPKVVLLLHGIGTSLLAFVSVTVTSGIALVLRGEHPVLGSISGIAMLSIILVIRVASLGSHLLGRSCSRRVQLAGGLALIIASLIWAGSFLVWFFGAGKEMWLVSTVAEIGASPFRVLIEPENSDLFTTLAMLILAAVVLTVVTGRAEVFVEPAVRESILANQLQKALSNGQVLSVQGRGYKAGLSSWARWPASPLATLLCSHLAQARRRRTQFVGTAMAMNAIVLVPILLEDYIPVATGLVVAPLVLTLSSPSQPASAELDHQHLLLANLSLVKAGVAGIFLNVLLDLLVCAPSVIIGVAIILGSPLWGFAFFIPLAAYFIASSFGGIGARAFSDAPLGRAFVSLLLGIIPLLIAIATVTSYSEANLVPRIWLTLTGTLAVSAILYAGIALSVFIAAKPQDT